MVLSMLPADVAKYLPVDVSTTKGAVVLNTLGVVVLASIVARILMRRSLSAPAPRVGRFTMAIKSFGDAAETRRDASRTFAAGSIFIDTGSEGTRLLRPPANVTPGVDAETVAKLMDALTSSLKAAMSGSGVDVSDALIARLLPMLTVNPAMDALAAAGEVPMLKHNKFLIKASEGALHVLTIGYVGALPGAKKKDEVLTVASPNLLGATDLASAGEYALSYALRRAVRTSLDEEMAMPGVAEVPVS
jgi:hypothetical protein